MDMLNDPSMREIVVDFCNESLELLDEMEECLDNFEDDPSDTSQLEKFGQVVDRIMGAAKSVGANEVANFSELGKIIGYKSSQVNDQALLGVTNAILFDTVDILREMVKNILDQKTKFLKDINTEAFGSRLRWLSEKFKNIERASVSYKKENNLDQNSIDDLMSSLGL